MQADIPIPRITYDLQTSELGWQARQEIYSFSQLIEIGGKREYHFKIASNEYYASLYGYETTKLERLYQLTKNFVHTVAAQELYQIAVEEQGIAQKFMDITHAKFESDKVSLVERNKTFLMKSMADMNVRQKKADFETAKKNLAIQWSASDRDFDFVAFPLYETPPPPSPRRLSCKIKRSAGNCPFASIRIGPHKTICGWQKLSASPIRSLQSDMPMMRETMGWLPA